MNVYTYILQFCTFTETIIYVYYFTMFNKLHPFMNLLEFYFADVAAKVIFAITHDCLQLDICCRWICDPYMIC